MVLLIGTREGCIIDARYVSSAERAWEIIREEIKVIADDAGMNAQEREESVTLCPSEAMIETWGEETRWTIIDAESIEHVE